MLRGITQPEAATFKSTGVEFEGAAGAFTGKEGESGRRWIGVSGIPESRCGWVVGYPSSRVSR